MIYYINIDIRIQDGRKDEILPSFYFVDSDEKKRTVNERKRTILSSKKKKNETHSSFVFKILYYEIKISSTISYLILFYFRKI